MTTNYPYKDLQQTIYGTEEPMKPPRLHGPLQSTVDPEVFYGEQVGSEVYPAVEFSWEDIWAAMEVLQNNSDFRVDYASIWGDTGERVDPPGVIMVTGSLGCSKAHPRFWGCQIEEYHGLDQHFPVEFQVLEATGCEQVYDDEYVVIDDEDAVYRIADAYGFSNVQWSPEHDWLTPESPIEDWIEWATEHDVDGPRIVAHQIGPDVIGEGFHEIGPVAYGEWEDEHGWGTEGFLEAIHKHLGTDVDVILENYRINQRGVYWRRNTDNMENGLCERCATAIEMDDWSAFAYEAEMDGSPGRAERFAKNALEQWGPITVEWDVPTETYEVPRTRRCLGCHESSAELYWFTPGESDLDDDEDDKGGDA